MYSAEDNGNKIDLLYNHVSKMMNQLYIDHRQSTTKRAKVAAINHLKAPNTATGSRAFVE